MAADSSTAAVTEYQRLVDLLEEEAHVHDLDADVRSYMCPNCREWCLNPVGSVVEEANVCVACHASYLATGSTGMRIASRMEDSDA